MTRRLRQAIRDISDAQPPVDEAEFDEEWIPFTRHRTMIFSGFWAEEAAEKPKKWDEEKI